MNLKSLLNCRFRSSRTWKWSHHVTEKFRKTFLRLGLRLILSKLFPFYSASEPQEFGWPNPNLRFLLFTFGASMFSLLNWARLKLSFLGIRKETTRWAGGRRSRRRNFLTQSCCYKVPEQGVFIFIFFYFFLPSPLGWIATLLLIKFKEVFFFFFFSQIQNWGPRSSSSLYWTNFCSFFPFSFCLNPF